ncbi:DUF4834 family protein [Hoylesella pleuritidis]|uniref:DUF4834 family protein n=1 Tax=Hoylesella pleuritidis TaxID=407975 RepID=UPI0028E5B25C|nr:DUF4834 family protein [Hoylesella pleuritidis]
MVTLLHFILIMILTAGIIVGIAIYIIYTRVKNASRNFRAQFGGSSKGQRRPKQTHTADGEIIIDNRTQNGTSRKIFSKNEGEYIDFKEEKSS